MQSFSIRTARLRLSPVTPDDLPAYTGLYADPQVIRYLPAGEPIPLLRAHQALAYMLDHWERCACGVFSIFDQSSGFFIGYCGVQHPHGRSAAGEFWESELFELLYALVRPAWGKGFAVEAARAALRFGFEEAHLPCIAAAVVPENRASWHVLEKVGMCLSPDLNIYGDIPHFVLGAEDFTPAPDPYHLLRA